MSREGSQEFLSRREGLSEGRAPSFSALNTQTQASGRVPRWQAVSDWHTGAPRRDGQSPAALILSRDARRDARRGQSTVSIRSHQTALTSTFIMVSSHSGRVSPGTEGRGNPCSSHLASSGCLRSSPWLSSGLTGAQESCPQTHTAPKTSQSPRAPSPTRVQQSC